MILGDDDRTGGTRTTLDDLFRRAGVRHPDALALADPPNRPALTGGAARMLTFAEADRAISALAARLRGLGLYSDTVVALQLGNTVESIIALLGVLRAGMIAAPVPLLWRQKDMVDALGRIGAKLIVTSARVGSCVHADIAMQVAAELFPIRYVCAFGGDLHDGVVPLDDIFDAGADVAASDARSENPASHVAVITFEAGGDGFVPVARNHAELIAGGMSVVLESGLAPDAPILSTIPTASFAGLALTLVPWLINGGALHLHHGFDADTFATQCRALNGGAVMLPEPVLAPLLQAGTLDGAGAVVALWRAPERMTSGAPWSGEAALTDVQSFGEIGLIAARRERGALPSPIPCGRVGHARGGAAAGPPLETMRKANTLLLRGAMVPVNAFPPGADSAGLPHIAAADDGFVDTGFACRADSGGRTLTVSGPPAGFAGIGGYRIRQNAVEALVAEADQAATIIAVPDALLGQRLAASSRDRAAVQADLQARGVNPLIAGAFRAR